MSSSCSTRRPGAPRAARRGRVGHRRGVAGATQQSCLPVPEVAGCRDGHGLAACWRTVCADADPGKVRLHDLRHAAATSHEVMSGEKLPPVGRLPGYRRYETAAVYARLGDAYLVGARRGDEVGSVFARAMRPRAIVHGVFVHALVGAGNRRNPVRFGTDPHPPGMIGVTRSAVGGGLPAGPGPRSTSPCLGLDFAGWIAHPYRHGGGADRAIHHAATGARTQGDRQRTGCHPWCH